MQLFLYRIVNRIADIHRLILSLNDAYEKNFTDKELHFLVIGVLGMLLVFAIHPLFLYLARQNHILTITAIYVFTVLVVITFAIEIGQKMTGTGQMEFADIMFGMAGFMVMFAIFAMIRSIIRLILDLIFPERVSKREAERKRSARKSGGK